MNNIKSLAQRYGKTLALCAVAAAIGAVTGVCTTVFGKVLNFVDAVRVDNFYLLIPFLAPVGAIISFFYKKYGKAANKGMKLIFKFGQDGEDAQDSVIPVRLIPLSVAATWLTNLFGGSSGREGVAVQIGATISSFFGRFIKIDDRKKLFVIIGMSAGFAGLFQTPLAAVFFAIEVLTVGALEYKALLPAAIASLSATATSRLLGLEHFKYDLDYHPELTVSFLFKIAVLGLIFAVVGGIFAFLLKNVKSLLENKIANPVLRTFLIGALISILMVLLHSGRYSGVGANIIKAAFGGAEIYPYDWILKLLLTVITLAAGFQGGEVTPLFTIGTALGFVIAPAFGLPLDFVAALGYVAVFCSGTNTFLAPILVGAEIFGYQNAPYFIAVCMISFIFNGNKSIYAQKRMKSLD